MTWKCWKLTCKVLNILKSFRWSIWVRTMKSCCRSVFWNNTENFDMHFRWSFSVKRKREKENKHIAPVSRHFRGLHSYRTQLLTNQGARNLSVILISNETIIVLFLLKSSSQFFGGFLLTLREQPTFLDATTCFPVKWRPRNDRGNSIMMTCHYPDLGSVSVRWKQISLAPRPIRGTTQIWVVTRHQFGICAVISQTSFCGASQWWRY